MEPIFGVHRGVHYQKIDHGRSVAQMNYAQKLYKNSAISRKAIANTIIK